METTETKVQHTPGNWSVEKHDIAPDTILTDHSGMTICDVFMTDYPEGAANALLIAAAPDLLSAAKDALESLKRLPNVDGAYRVTNIHQLELAITKAEQG